MSARLLTIQEIRDVEAFYAEDVDKEEVIPVLVVGCYYDKMTLLKASRPYKFQVSIYEYNKRWRGWLGKPREIDRKLKGWNKK